MNNNNNYKTVSINGVVISGEEVSYVTRTNCFVGDHIGAMTKNGNFFTEREARSLLLLETDTKLVKNGIGHIGDNVIVMGFKNKLTLEAKKRMAKGLMNM